MQLKKQNFTADFAKCIVGLYGDTVQKSYRSIAQDLGTISFTTVKHHMDKLESLGIVTIENKGNRQQVFHISINQLNKMMEVWQQD